MKYTTGELIDINARSSQLLLVLSELELCKTKEDYEAAVERLKQQARENAAKTRDGLN